MKTILKKLISVMLVLAMLCTLSLLLISCSGEKGEKGDKGDKGETGDMGAAGTTPQLRINPDTNFWEVSYDYGVTWTSLGVKANGTAGPAGPQGPTGATGATGPAGAAGAPGSQISIGANGNWFIDGIDTGFKASGTSPNEFVPVLRFAVSSDLHLRATDYDYQSGAMLDGLFDTAYAYSATQRYNALDAVIFAGDFTDNGSEDELTKFFNYVNDAKKGNTVVRAVLGNHEYYTTKTDDGISGNDDRYNSQSIAGTYEKFLRISGYDSVDAHLVIGGYHFIMLNTDRYAFDYAGSKFSPAKLAWLETELEAAAADDPTGTKPIFVFQHMPASETVNNAKQWSSDDHLEAIFNKYPQVVDFSGHTHFPITDPQSVWQDGYTAINTASLAYLCTYIAGHPQYDDSVIIYKNGYASGTSGQKTDSYVVPTDWEGSWNASGSNGVMRNAGLYYIVEVSATNEVRLVVYNIYTESVQMIVYVGNVGDPANFNYTDSRKNTAAPTFLDGAAVTPQMITKNYALLNIPQASCPAGVNNYRVELYKGATHVSTTYRLSCAFLGFAMPTTVAAPLSGLSPSTAYEVRVYPVSNWDVAGDPLIYRFTTAGSTSDPVADVLSVSFNTDGTATNAITGKLLDTAGAPTVAYDATLGRNVATLNGTSGYAFQEMFQHYARIQEGFTLETYIYVSAKPSSAKNVIANMEGGGFGFQYNSAGEVQILCHGSSGYDRAIATLPVGEWVHVVGVYTGTKIQLYFNGVLKNEVNATKTSWSIPSNGSHYLSIGGDSSPSAPAGSNFFTGKMAVANLYSDALSAAEIAALYQDIIS